MSEISDIYNLRRAERSFKRHGFSKEHHMRPLKIGPEPFNTQILRGIYYITSTTMPTLTREGKDVPFQGSILKEKGQLQFGNETTIGFKTAGDFLAYNSLQKWSLELGNPLDGSGNFCVGEDSTIQYAIVNDAGRIVRAVEFRGVFPSSIGEITYNNESDNPTTFDVTFTYNYWVPLDIEELDLDRFEDAAADSDSAETNRSLVFDNYEKLISDNDKKSDACE
jgi:hypothetical protein